MAGLLWLLLFVGLPATELALLIEIGSRIGTGATLMLILVTGVVGAALARRQGLRILGQVQSEMAEGRLPAGPMIDGVMVLIAAALLVTPGVLTDVFGFLCLTPGFRSMLKRAVVRRMERAVAEQRVVFSMYEARGAPPGFGPGEVDVTERGRDERRSFSVADSDELGATKTGAAPPRREIE